MYKIPVSVLVIIHTPDMRILLLERADHPVCLKRHRGKAHGFCGVAGLAGAGHAVEESIGEIAGIRGSRPKSLGRQASTCLQMSR